MGLLMARKIDFSVPPRTHARTLRKLQKGHTIIYLDVQFSVEMFFCMKRRQ
jgi:hypothetical protein